MIKSKKILPLLLLTGLFIIHGCSDKGPTGFESGLVVSNEQTTVNPSGFAPLSAQIEVETDIETRISIRIPGTDGPESDITQEFEELKTSHIIPVHGLYADQNNPVELTFFGSSGAELGTKTYDIETSPLIPDLPQININKANRSQMVEGLTLVSYFGYDGQSTPQRPFIYDSFGKIRWYLDYSSDETLGNLFYDDGIERLQNGNFYFGDLATDKIYETNLFGEIINNWDLPGYGFHHEVSEKPNGNFLVTVNKVGSNTIEDHIVEIDREANEIMNVWDLNESLDNRRRTWETDRANLNVDWLHANSVEYDESDNTIVVSGRTQGLVKLTENNEVVWILAPHKGWETSGNGTELSQFLLQPLDANGAPITQNAVLEGDENHPDFEWAWYQHAVEILPDGRLMLFDNGENRNYSGNGPYSRAVEYEIDKENGTIQQRWTYGKQRGGETFSSVVSDVDYYPDEDHVFFSPGATVFNNRIYGKEIEIDRESQEVIFEATIIPPTPAFGIATFHRTERLPLYPE
jgi:arylsulfate sulfotransferase